MSAHPEGGYDVHGIPREQTLGWEGRHGRVYCECGRPMMEGPEPPDEEHRTVPHKHLLTCSQCDWSVDHE